MNTRIRIIPFLLLGVLMLFSACELIVPVELPRHDPVIVVNSLFSNDSTWQVHLSTSLGITDQADLQELAGATAILTSQGQTLDTLEEGLAIYQTGIKPEIGREYTIQVSHPDYPDVSATSRMPVAVSPSVVEFDSIERQDAFGEPFHEVSVTIQDPPGVSNYYQFSFMSPDTSIFGTDTTIYNYNYYIEPALGNNFDTEVIWGGVFLSDSRFDGQEITIKFNLYYWWDDRAIYMLFGNVSEDYYKYTLSLETWNNSNGNPFAEPVNIHSNTTNNFGIFAGVSRIRTRIY